MINDIIEKIDLHKSRAKNALLEIKSWTSFSSEIFEDFEKIKTICKNHSHLNTISLYIRTL